MMRLKVFPSLFRDIFCPLYGMAKGLVASGDDSHYPGFRHTKSGRQFAGVEYAQSPTGACADIEQPSASSHPFFDGFHQRLYLGKSLMDAFCDSAVFLIDVLKQFHH